MAKHSYARGRRNHERDRRDVNDTKVPKSVPVKQETVPPMRISIPGSASVRLKNGSSAPVKVHWIDEDLDLAEIEYQGHIMNCNRSDLQVVG